MRSSSTVWVLLRRLNSSWSRSIALVVRALLHWLSGNRVKVKSRSPASSRLSATALHLSRHLRMKALGCMGEQVAMLVDGAALGRHVAPQGRQRLLQPGPAIDNQKPWLDEP